jgi:tetratricopeptide (TPR) repeat protein
MSTTTINPALTQLSENVQRALALQRKGQFAQAQIVYEAILATAPKHFDALHLLGVIAAQTKNPKKAVELIGKAIEVNGKNAAARNNRGLALAELRQWHAALADFDEAIAIKGDFDEAHFNRGNVLCELKKPQAALASYNETIAIKASHAPAHFNRGNVLSALNQPEAALASYDHAIAIKPDFAEAYANRGVVLSVLNRPEAALASYNQAIAIKPDHAETYSNRGVVLTKLKQPAAALASCEQAIALRADYAEAYSNRGMALCELKQFDAALASYNQAIAIKADYAEAYFNRGNVLRDLRQSEAALASYDQAIAAGADHAKAYSNRGNVLRDLKQLEAALASYDQAIAIEPDYAEAHTNKSTALLLGGDLKNGWVEYEWRWKNEDANKVIAEQRSFRHPVWHGDKDVAGKTILLHCEQGLGDTLQFSRYGTLVAALGARVILEVQEPLTGLLSGLEGVSQVIAKGNALPHFDTHCPVMSLPLAFGTTLDSVPTSSAYLRADARRVENWKARLRDSGRPRIGLAWSGNPNHAYDHDRSISLADLIQYLPEDFQFVSLQREVRERDRQALQSSGNILNFAQDLDFDSTAALCGCLDLVISVDTSLAHLSGALGKETWILLSFVPDWRWLLERDDSPWYPTVKLYRQDKRNDWTRVFDKVHSDLTQRFKSK